MTRRYLTPLEDQNEAQSAVADLSRSIEQRAGSDQIFDNERRVFARSDNGKFWLITVSDTGVLTTTDFGTEFPS